MKSASTPSSGGEVSPPRDTAHTEEHNKIGNGELRRVKNGTYGQLPNMGTERRDLYEYRGRGTGRRDRHVRSVPALCRREPVDILLGDEPVVVPVKPAYHLDHRGQHKGEQAHGGKHAGRGDLPAGGYEARVDGVVVEQHGDFAPGGGRGAPTAPRYSSVAAHDCFGGAGGGDVLGLPFSHEKQGVHGRRGD